MSVVGLARLGLDLARVNDPLKRPERLAVFVNAELHALDRSAFKQRFCNGPIVLSKKCRMSAR